MREDSERGRDPERHGTHERGGDHGPVDEVVQRIADEDERRPGREKALPSFVAAVPADDRLEAEDEARMNWSWRGFPALRKGPRRSSSSA